MNTVLANHEWEYIETKEEKSLCVSTKTFDYIIKNDRKIYNYRNLDECAIEAQIHGGMGANRIWRE